MKVRLLNGGGYGFKKGVVFPVEVEGDFEVEKGLMETIHITKEELAKVGLKHESTEGTLMFFLGKEAKIIEETTKPSKKLVGFKIKNCNGAWFLDYNRGLASSKDTAHIYPVNFMDNSHAYYKELGQVLIPVYN